MINQTKGQQKGFTIIEVVLVLAIAALIFLMVFIALPALQRGQRDTARKQDANTVITALNTWKGNHRGSLPNFGDSTQKIDFQTNYVKKLGQYEATEDTTYVIKNDQIAGADVLTTNTIQIATAAKCSDDGSTLDSASTVSKRSAAVVIRLEASDAAVCIDG